MKAKAPPSKSSPSASSARKRPPASAGAVDPVARIADAARRLPGDAEGALRALVEAWQSTRAPAIGALVERVSAVASRGAASITGTTVDERQRAWLAVEKAGRSGDLDRLLAVLTDCRCAQARERLARLAARPQDPRVLRALVDIIDTDPDRKRGGEALHRTGEGSPLPFTSEPNRGFWTDLFALVEQLGDASTAARLASERLKRSRYDWLTARVERARPVLTTRAAVPLDPGAPAAIALVTEAVEKMEAAGARNVETAEALYAAVWAEPDRDEPRHVLADFLTERGDPRGEFIALQMARAQGTLKAEGKKREKELLKRHKKEWLGPIAPLIQPAHNRFERGFIVTCSIEPNPELERTLGDHPAWSTIREFLVHGYAQKPGAALAKMLESRGAKRHPPGYFTRGIE